MPKHIPVVLMIRHPDEETELHLYGLDDVREMSIDLGRSFDISSLQPGDKNAAEEYVEGLTDGVKDLPHDHPARVRVEEIIAEILAALRTLRP